VFLEHVILNIIPEQEAEWEAALREAIPLLLASDGCKRAQLLRCVETPSRYLLLVQWEAIDDHLIGFKTSARYEVWTRLVHPFPIPPEISEHYSLVLHNES
jgi:heme-degrading monooxygenase HmoA